MFKLSLPDAHIVAKFILDGKKYDVEKFNIGFTQSTDFKGQPQNEVKGGQILVILPQAVGDDIYNWAKKSTQLKDGQVVFQTDMGMTVLSVNFTNAYCVNLARDFTAVNGTKSTLIITPESVSLNGVTHENIWKK